MAQTTLSFGDLARLVREDASGESCVDLGSPIFKGEEVPWNILRGDTAFLVSGARIYNRQLFEDNWVRSGVMTDLEAEDYLTLQVPWKIRRGVIAQPSSIDEAVEQILPSLAKLAQIKLEEASSSFYIVAGYMFQHPAMVSIHHQSGNWPSPTYCMVSVSARKEDKELHHYFHPYRSVRLSLDIPVEASVFRNETSVICQSLLEGNAAFFQRVPLASQGSVYYAQLKVKELLQGLLSYIQSPIFQSIAGAAVNS